MIFPTDIPQDESEYSEILIILRCRIFSLSERMCWGGRREKQIPTWVLPRHREPDLPGFQIGQRTVKSHTTTDRQSVSGIERANKKTMRGTGFSPDIGKLFIFLELVTLNQALDDFLHLGSTLVEPCQVYRDVDQF